MQTPDVMDARWPPGCLADQLPGVTRHASLVALLRSLNDGYEQWQTTGADRAVVAFSARDALRGRPLSLEVGNRSVEGIGAGIDAFGRLQLETDRGTETFASGEVVRVN